MKDVAVVTHGRRVRVQVGGQGPALLMLHGFASSSEGWPRDRLSQLSRTRTLVAVDLPGHGRSDPVHEDVLTPESVVDIVVAVVREVVGEAPIHWYGYSMGARIALSALRLGVPIRGLGLESANPGLEDDRQRQDRVASDATWAERFQTDSSATPASTAALDAWLDQPIFASRIGLDPDEAAHQRRVREVADFASLGRWLRGFGTGVMPPTWRALRDFEGPLDLLVGAEDAKYRELATRIQERRPGTSVTVVPGVGHAPHMEAPSAWSTWMSALPATG